jgi:MSHA pilin protein MshA
MKFRERGINIVEVGLVLVVVAILASTAIPSFVADRSNAHQAAVEGVASSLESASAINYAVRRISPSHGIRIANCADVAHALEGQLNDDYTIEPAGITPDSKAECTVKHQSGLHARFEAKGIL